MSHKTISVAGTSRGIGKAATVKFAKKSYNVTISCVHREEQLMQTWKEIESFQVLCLIYKGDMGDMACYEGLLLKIEKMFGGVDVLVNNAGISYIGLLQGMTPADWEHVLYTNLTSAFNCRKLAVPYMISQKQGKTINVSSVWGVMDVFCGVTYSATKGGISALTKTLAEELVPSNIQVNAIAYGATDAGMNQRMDKDDPIALVDETPSRRLGRTEEVTGLAYHLSYKEPYLTGQIIGLGGEWIQTGGV